MLTKGKLSPDLQIERWEDRRDIKNLMGRYAYDCLMKNERDIYEKYWSAQEDVCLMLPQGTYKGRAAVRGYYAALDRYNSERAKWYRDLMPDQTAKYSDAEMYGIGSYHGMHLTTPCVVVADDGETAQAIYWVHDVADEMCEAGNVNRWSLGLLFIDLRYEDDGWRLWHMRCAYEVDGPHGQPFGTERALPGEPIPYLVEELQKVAQWFPRPNDPTPSHEKYYPGRGRASYPQPPKPYQTWDDAQSYGV